MYFLKQFTQQLTNIHASGPRARRWSFPKDGEPGKWAEPYDLRKLMMCNTGWHLAPASRYGINRWINCPDGNSWDGRVFIAEIPDDAEIIIEHGMYDKFVSTSARLVRELTTDEIKRLFTEKSTRYRTVPTVRGSVKTLPNAPNDGPWWYLQHCRSRYRGLDKEVAEGFNDGAEWFAELHNNPNTGHHRHNGYVYKGKWNG